MFEREAMYYTELSENKVKCELCANNCVIQDSSVGFCKVRRNIGGKLYSLNYGKIVALMVDPIEKKPLYHFYPGSKTLSVAMQGCNFNCQFCQNHSISQINSPLDIKGEELKPEDIIKIAKAKNVKIISYTYTEPTIFYEYMLELSMLAKSEGMKNIMVTNGFMNEGPLKEIVGFIDAFNVDLKSFRGPSYENLIGGRLDVVLGNLEIISQSDAWLEITTLLIPDFNDTKEEIEDIARYIAHLGKDIPWHVSKYFPNYKMKTTNKETPLDTLAVAYGIGSKAGLNYVYVGNIEYDRFSATRCTSCNSVVIQRQGYNVTCLDGGIEKMKGKCFNCGANITGVF